MAGDMFRVPETEGGRAGSRAMKPPGGDSSSLFGSPEEAVPSSRPNRMASNIFGPTEEPQNVPKRTNPPGGKGSGIFDESMPVQTRQRLNPLAGRPVTSLGPRSLLPRPWHTQTSPRTTCSCVRGGARPGPQSRSERLAQTGARRARRPEGGGLCPGARAPAGQPRAQAGPAAALSQQSPEPTWGQVQHLLLLRHRRIPHRQTSPGDSLDRVSFSPEKRGGERVWGSPRPGPTAVLRPWPSRCPGSRRPWERPLWWPGERGLLVFGMLAHWASRCR